MVKIDKKYVVGFYIDTDGNVILIEKQKPDWQKGFLNGVGGHIELDETPLQAMEREFMEETDIHEPIKWQPLCAMTQDHEDGVLYCFYATGHPLEPKTVTHEKVGVYPIVDLWQLKVHQNIRWMIPLALDRDIDEMNVRVFYK